MKNRTIGLIIITLFLLLGLVYYYGIEKNPINNKVSKIIETKVIKSKNYKKATLEKIEIDYSKKSLLSLTEEEKKELEQKKINKIKLNITRILKLNDNNKVIEIKEIDGDEKNFLVNIEKMNYIYNNKRLNLSKLDLNIKINYAKKINRSIYLITEKGTFIYKNKKIEFFPTFSDFIVNNGNFIGIIKDSDKTIKNNFNYSDIYGNLVVLYNPKKSEKRILFKPDFEIKKILLENNKVILVNQNEEKFLLNF